MGMTNLLTSANSMSRMLDKSMGVSNILASANKMNTMVDRIIGNNIGMGYLLSASKKQTAYLGIGSLDWLAKGSVLQQISLPNNIFNLSKSLGQGITGMLAQDIGRQNINKALTQGISSLIGNSSFNKLINTQHNILNQLSGVGLAGISANQYRNTFNTLGSLSASVAWRGLASSVNMPSLPYLEDIATEVEEITTSVTTQQYITTNDLTGIYNLINDINKKIDSIDRSEFKTFGLWLCLIGIFFTIYPVIQQKLDASDPNKAAATQQQVMDLRNKLLAAYHNNVNLYSPIRITNRKCKVFLKPRLKSCQVMIAMPNSKLSIINTRGKWVMVTCLDRDSLPVTGWILKKYLSKATLKAN